MFGGPKSQVALNESWIMIIVMVMMMISMLPEGSWVWRCRLNVTWHEAWHRPILCQLSDLEAISFLMLGTWFYLILELLTLDLWIINAKNQIKGIELKWRGCNQYKIDFHFKIVSRYLWIRVKVLIVDQSCQWILNSGTLPLGSILCVFVPESALPPISPLYALSLCPYCVEPH